MEDPFSAELKGSCPGPRPDKENQNTMSKQKYWKERQSTILFSFIHINTLNAHLCSSCHLNAIFNDMFEIDR